MQTEGLFAVISGVEYTNEEILPTYYQRQSPEQIFDFAKNYTKLLPLRTNNAETFHGHLLLSYIVSCAGKMIHVKLKQRICSFERVLHVCVTSSVRSIKTEPLRILQKDVNDTYRTFGIDCPTSIPMLDGVLQYKRPNSDTLAQDKKKRNSKAKTANESEMIDATKKKLGRPKGAKNKATLEREANQKNIHVEPKKVVLRVLRTRKL